MPRIEDPEGFLGIPRNSGTLGIFRGLLQLNSSQAIFYHGALQGCAKASLRLGLARLHRHMFLGMTVLVGLSECSDTR